MSKPKSFIVLYNGKFIRAYKESEADKVIAEKDKEIARLADLAHAHNLELLCKENLIAELKAKLESVDAGMENRRLKRALWLARAERAKWQSLYYWYAISDKYKSRKFDVVETKCRAKAEEYK